MKAGNSEVKNGLLHRNRQIKIQNTEDNKYSKVANGYTDYNLNKPIQVSGFLKISLM